MTRVLVKGCCKYLLQRCPHDSPPLGPNHRLMDQEQIYARLLGLRTHAAHACLQTRQKCFHRIASSIITRLCQKIDGISNRSSQSADICDCIQVSLELFSVRVPCLILTCFYRTILFCAVVESIASSGVSVSCVFNEEDWPVPIAWGSLPVAIAESTFELRIEEILRRVGSCSPTCATKSYARDRVSGMETNVVLLLGSHCCHLSPIFDYSAEVRTLERNGDCDLMLSLSLLSSILTAFVSSPMDTRFGRSYRSSSSTLTVRR